MDKLFHYLELNVRSTSLCGPSASIAGRRWQEIKRRASRLAASDANSNGVAVQAWTTIGKLLGSQQVHRPEGSIHRCTRRIIHWNIYARMMHVAPHPNIYTLCNLLFCWKPQNASFVFSSVLQYFNSLFDHKSIWRMFFTVINSILTLA
jgi:hypothetical protein